MSSREKAVLDRIVDGVHAVIHVGEAETEHIVPVELLPEGTTEGDWLRVRMRDGEVIEVETDETETTKMKERIAEKMGKLRKRGRRS